LRLTRYWDLLAIETTFCWFWGWSYWHC